MYILMVRLKVKQDHINDFIKASIADGTGSVLREPNCHRFDIIQDETDPALFAFNEVYSDEAAFEHHKTTPRSSSTIGSGASSSCSAQAI